MRLIYLLQCGIIALGAAQAVAQTEQDTTTRRLQQVDIRDTREPIRRLAPVQGTQIFAGKKADVISVGALDANLVTNNARQIFARTPGVSVWENDGSGIQVGVAVRGLSPNRSWEFNVRQNGYDVSSDVFGYPEAYYNPPMEAVQDIQLIRGSASLQFGAQFGGLLNYVLKKGSKTKPFEFENQTTLGSYGLWSTYNAIGGTVGRWNYYAYTHQRGAEGWRQNSRYRVEHYHAQINYAINSKGNIGFEFTHMDYDAQQAGGLTDAQFGQDARQSARARNWFGTPWYLMALNFDYQISNNFKLNTKIFGLIGERNSIGFVPSGGITVADVAQNNVMPNRQIDRDFYNNIGTELRTLYTYQLFGQTHHLASGLRYSHSNTRRKQSGRGDNGADFNLNLQTDAFPRELDFTTSNMAAFAENVFQITPQWSVVPGIRFDHIVSGSSGRLSLNADGSPNNVNPTSVTRQVLLWGIGSEYKLSQGITLYANYSRAFRPVYYSELTPPATTDVIDPNLRDANGFNAEAGFRGVLGKREWLRWDMNYFWLQYNDRIGTLTLARDDASRYQFRTNVGNTLNQGVELYTEFSPTQIGEKKSTWGNVQMFASVSWINAKYQDFATRTFNTSTNQFVDGNLSGNRVENAPQYIQRFGLNYTYKTFSFTTQLSRVGNAFADANNTETPTANAVSGLIPAYQVWDTALSLRFLNNYLLRAGVNNLTDARYFTRRSGGYPGPGLLPADGRTWFLSLGIKI